LADFGGDLSPRANMIVVHNLGRAGPAKRLHQCAKQRVLAAPLLTHNLTPTLGVKCAPTYDIRNKRRRSSPAGCVVRTTIGKVAASARRGLQNCLTSWAFTELLDVALT
jgi:hypothetical protein